MAWVDRFNSFLYNTRERVLRSYRNVLGLATLIALSILIVVYGFELSQNTIEILFNVLDLIFGLFVFSFLLRLLFNFQRWQFIRENITESIAMLIILLHGITNLLLPFVPIESLLKSIGFINYPNVYRVLVTLFLLFIIGIDFVKTGTSNIFKKVSPPTFFILSFLALIVLGTILLILPKMSVEEGSMDLVDALFTAVSASCVTGLIVVDTSSYFTFQGQIVILFLMQLGGLGIISFATFFAFYIGQGVGIRQQSLIQDFMSSESIFSTQGLIRQIIFFTLFIEMFGAFLLFASWDPSVEFKDLGERLFYSVFHSVSAFCNAGFALFPEGYYTEHLRFAYFHHLILAALIIMGGLGFGTLQDLFSPHKLRERMEKPWVDWKLSTKVVLYTSGALIIIGMIMIFLLENDNTLKGLQTSEKIIDAFFLSVTSRTAGFNTLDTASMKLPTLIFVIFLMFIGASPGSTGGGIKTSTFLLIFVSVIATIKGKDSIDLGKRSIPSALLYKALTVFAFASTYNLLGVFVLSIAEPEIAIFDLVFEHVSAFATVGLSTGITSQLSDMGKLIIMISMFLGRIGTLTLAVALAGYKEQPSFKYPTAHLMIG